MTLRPEHAAARERLRLKKVRNICASCQEPSLPGKTRCQEHHDAVGQAVLDRRRRAIEDPSVVPHGTKSGYSNWGCKCRACCVAMGRSVPDATPTPRVVPRVVPMAVPVPFGRRSGRSTVREHVADHTHDALVALYVERNGLPEKCARRFANGAVCDLVHPSKRLVIEVKPRVTRSEIQKALGELDDYIRFLPASYKRAVLLPEQPSADLADLLRSRGVRVLVEEAA